MRLSMPTPSSISAYSALSILATTFGTPFRLARRAVIRFSSSLSVTATKAPMLPTFSDRRIIPSEPSPLIMRARGRDSASSRHLSCRLSIILTLMSISSSERAR